MTQRKFNIIKTNLPEMALKALEGNEFAWKGFMENVHVHPLKLREQYLANQKNNVNELTEIELTYLRSPKECKYYE